jgi:integrase
MSLYKRKGSKYWWYKFKFKGKPYRQSTGKTSSRKAAADEEDRKAQVRRIWLGLEQEKPKTAPAEVPKFKTYAEEWLDVYVKVNCKEGTYLLNKQIIDDHLEPAFGHKRLDAITRPMIEVFIAKKIAKKLSKATVRNCISVLRVILAKAVRDEVLQVNRASGMGRFSKETGGKAARKHVQPLTEAEVQLFLAKAREKSFVLYAFYLTAILTGMRISELIGLHWGDVDRINHRLYVRRAVTHRREETPKNHHQRQIDMADQLEPVLEQLRKYRAEEWLKKGKPMPDWVFCNDEGSHLNEFIFRMRKFYPLIKALKMRAFRIHDLRHTFASMHLAHGASINWLKEQMGHHSIQVTVDTYGHLIPTETRTAANRLGAAIVNAPPQPEAAQAQAAS